MEGTPPRARASARGHSFSTDPPGLQDLRVCMDPRLPSIPAPDFDGKEGVPPVKQVIKPSDGLEPSTPSLPFPQATVLMSASITVVAVSVA